MFCDEDIDLLGRFISDEIANISADCIDVFSKVPDEESFFRKIGVPFFHIILNEKIPPIRLFRPFFCLIIKAVSPLIQTIFAEI